MHVKLINPEYFKKKVSLQSYGTTHVFPWPSDCLTIKTVWDMGTNAIAISGAADNGSGAIRITTSAAHGFSEDDIIHIHGVVGCTEANDTWQITYQSTTTFDLDGSTFTNTYTSGGYAFEESSDRARLFQISEENASDTNDSVYYIRNNKIVVDDVTFNHDLILLYVYTPSVLTDIPAEYHQALVNWNVVQLVKVPRPQDPRYEDLKKQYAKHQGLWDFVTKQITQTLRPHEEAVNVADTEDYIGWPE